MIPEMQAQGRALTLGGMRLVIDWARMPKKDGVPQGRMDVHLYIWASKDASYTVKRRRTIELLNPPSQFQYIKSVVKLLKALGLQATRDEIFPILNMKEKDKQVVSDISIYWLIHQREVMNIAVSAGFEYNLEHIGFVGSDVVIEENIQMESMDEEAQKELANSLADILNPYNLDIRFEINVEIPECKEQEDTDTSIPKEKKSSRRSSAGPGTSQKESQK